MRDALSVLHGLTERDLARPALVTDSATWTFAELRERVSDLADRLSAQGIREGTRVALVAAGTPEVFLAIHALAAMRATLAPIHPRLSPSEARDVIATAGAVVELDPASRRVTPLAGTAGATGVHSDPTGSDPCVRNDPAGDAAPFAIVSTSGTTGRPKGAVLSRRAILAAAEASARNLGWEEDDRWLLCMPLAHVGGLSIVTRCLLARRAVVMLPRFEAAPVLGAIPRHRVTLMSVVPTMLHALIEADADRALALPRALLVGGAASSPALLGACERRGIRALPTYGLTEACSQVTCGRPADLAEVPRPPGVGAPLDGFEVRIADQDGEPLPAGQVGRILVRGEALFDGYLVSSEASLREDAAGSTALDRRWLPHERGALFDTGDLGELDARGRLHVYTRRTDLVVTGGENVYPAEVEQALERCAGVRRALVFGVPDERWGQLVAAVVEVDPAATAQIGSLAEALSAVLAPHKRPRRWALVDQLPLTPSGKVDRKDALARFGEALSPD